MRSLLALIPCLLASQAAAAPTKACRVRTTALTPPPPTSSPTPVSSSCSPSSSPSTPSAPSTPSTPSTSSGSEYVNGLYFTNWGIYGANFQPQQIPADKVTRIMYSFAKIGSDGTVSSSDTYADLEKHYAGDAWTKREEASGTKNAYGCVRQMYLLKKQHRHLKVLLAIGGWSDRDKFAPIAATAEGRQRFAESSTQLIADWGFDGIDIDWEYPQSATEAQDFVKLLAACRKALDAYAAQHAPGYHFLLTVASPAGSSHYNTMDLAGMDEYVDAWDLMAYDYAGSWDTTTGHASNLYADPANSAATKFNTESVIVDYLAKGIAAHKIILGLPLYGRAFEETSGLGQSYNGVGPGALEAGIWPYHDLPRSGATVSFDDVTKSAYSYDASTRELISFDDVESTKQKSAFIAAKGLGGAFFWEASGDRNDSQSLITTVKNELGHFEASQNLLSFPVSQYANIRAGMPDN